MTTYGVSKWFTIEADSIEDAYEAADKIGEAVMLRSDIECTDHGDIDIEEHEE